MKIRTNLLVAALGLGIMAVAEAASAGLVVDFSSRNTTVAEGVNAKNDGSYDRLRFTLDAVAFTGADNVTGPLGQTAALLDLHGTFTVFGGYMAAPGSDVNTDPGYWENYVTSGKGGTGTESNGDDTFTYAASYVNLPSLSPGASRSTAHGVAGSQTDDGSGDVDTIQGIFKSITGEWYSSSGLVGGNKLCDIFVTPGADVVFNGTYTTYGTNQTGSIVFSDNQSLVPEPASLSMLYLGAIGLLARRRARVA